MHNVIQMKKLILLIVALGSGLSSAWAADDAATRKLVEQARYWQQSGRDDLAIGAWQKLLRADANHPEGLVRLGVLQARAGQLAQAQELYLRATQLAAAPAGLAELEMALRAGKNAPAIRAARKLAQAGQPEAAASNYRSALGTSKPTGQLGLEYYQTLGATREGWDEARGGLEELVRASPENPRYVFALARHLTYREATRREGIRRLSAMSQADPEVRQSLSQALVWLDARRADRALMTGYLSRNPDDQAVQERLAALDQSLADARKGVRQKPSQAGFTLLEQGDVEAAGARFEAILAKKPRDADSLGGLGTVRLRQQSFAEALRLLDQAMLRDRRNAGRWKQARDSAHYWTLIQQVVAAREAGKLIESEEKLAQATKLDDQQVLGQVLWGDLWLEKRQLDKAEAMYRLALKTSASDPGAFRGLIAVLLRTAREAEAMALISTLDEATAQKMGGLNQLKANAMLKLAEADERAADYRAAVTRLEVALMLDPADPWVRLALARQYQRLGDPGRAQTMLEALLTIQPKLPEALHARALLYAEQKMWPEALATIERIPVPARNANILDDLRRISVNLQVRRAQQLYAQGNLRQAREVAQQAELQASGDISLSALVAGCWSGLGQPAEALRLMRDIVQRLPADNIDLRIQYAGVLLDDKRDAELTPVLRALAQSPRLSTTQQEDINKIILAFTLRQIDALRQTGQLDDALRIVSQALERSDEPRLLMALARIENSAGDSRKALATAEEVIAREPGDLDHRLFAIAVALAAKAPDTAALHAEVALEIAPEDVRALMAMARVQRESGNPEQALQYLERAQALQRPRVANSARGTDLAAAPANEHGGLLPIPELRESKGVASASRPALARVPEVLTPVITARSITAAPAPVPTPREPTLEDEISAMKLKLALTMDVTPRFRTRTGEPGLGRLSEFEFPIELALPSGGNGAFTLKLTPTVLGVGTLNRSDPGNIARVGSAGLGPLQAGFDPVPDQDASGVGLSVGYRDEDMSLRIGTTPLGFLVTHLVGELSFATRLEDFTLKGVLSRRAVTDSVLSAAGMRDPQTLQVWGGVVKTGAQFNFNFGGDERGVYADLGAAQLSGQGVKDNTQFEASMGAYWRIYQSSSAKFKAGLNMTAMAYRDNLGFYTLGHGGYFSPQQYFSLGIPWELSGRRGALSYQIGGDFSLQKFSQDRVAYFPNDAKLQSAWVLKAGALYPTYYEAESGSGLGYNLFGSFEYLLAPRFTLGGRLTFENSRNFSQQAGSFYLRYAFDGLGPAFGFQ